MILRSMPSLTVCAFPKGIVKSGPGFPNDYRLAVEVFMLEEQDRSSQRMAVRKSPATSRAVEGITTRRPGQCAKIDSPL